MNLDPEPERLISQLILILVLTMVNAFFASAEMAIVSVNKTKIKNLAKEGNKKAKLLERLIEDPSNFLATIQVGITLAGFFSSASAGVGIASMLSEKINIPYSETISMVIVTLILSYITLVFGELVPKRIALKKAENIALFSVKPIYFVSIVTKPFIKILSLSTRIVLRLLGHKDDNTEEEVSEEEIRSLILQSEEQGSINKDEKDMIESVFEFNDKLCKEIMTPRKDTYLIDIDDDIEEYIDELINLPYSRIPVYEDNIDNIIGVLHIKDLLIQAKKVGFENIDIREIIKKPYFALNTEKANQLFKTMQLKKNHIALLIDEYGGFCGVVSMEDLIEEIMGDIEDEYDIEDQEIVKLEENSYMVRCSIGLSEFNERFGLNLEEGDYDTLNGYIITQLGEIPKVNEERELEVEGINIKVSSVNDNRIEKVKVTYLESIEAKAN